jgi:type 1 glutamine amidotransferase
MNKRVVFAVMLALVPANVRADERWVVYDGQGGPGKGKHIVLIAGDHEYRSEETIPQLAKILAKHHGFKCTVLFTLDPKDGAINPNIDNIPGLENLASADLMIMFLRFRNLPDDQMKHLADYIESGKPIIGLRTSTHAFNLRKDSPYYAKYQWNFKEGGFGFGKKVLGETWVNHHGAHGKQATRGIIAQDQAGHPIVRGIKDGDIFGPSDVYGVNLPLPGDSLPLVLGQVVAGMKETDPPLAGKKNDPMMPIAWTRTYKGEAGKTARVFTTTMGASQDFSSEGLRRLIVNATYWSLGMEDRIPERANVAIVGEYRPRPFRNDGFQKGVRPADLEMK